MKIAVCEDCTEDALFLKSLLGGNEVSVYSDGGSLLADLETKGIQYDLYLLDIFLGEAMNGIELAGKLIKIQEEAVVCFISTSNDFYREAYDLYAVQYLLKPIQREAVKKLLDKVEKDLAKSRGQKLFFQSRGHTGSILYAKILYISSRDHTLSIYCTDGEVQRCKGKLNEMALKVCGDTFMRCHQSFIVNMYHVECLSGTDLTVAGVRIPVSRRYYTEVKKRYQEILFEGVD